MEDPKVDVVGVALLLLANGDLLGAAVLPVSKGDLRGVAVLLADANGEVFVAGAAAVGPVELLAKGDGLSGADVVGLLPNNPGVVGWPKVDLLLESEVPNKFDAGVIGGFSWSPF